ncbi:MAG TPA: hypothetical protein VHF67_01900 [Gaiellaceae bacterium]|nr:hypothetical protein [Gaiellaceae bacterium]
MTDWLDRDPEMGTLAVDSYLADRILSGGLPPEESPAGLAEVAVLVRALRAEPTTEELARQEQTVAAIGAIVRSRTEPVAASRPRRRLGTTRLRVALAFAASLLGATTALAAAGELPGRAQDVASDVLRTIGIEVPKSEDEQPSAPRPGRSNGEAPAQSPTGVAGTADEGRFGPLARRRGETETAPPPPVAGDGAHDEVREQPAAGSGAAPPTGLSPLDQESGAAPSTGVSPPDQGGGVAPSTGVSPPDQDAGAPAEAGTTTEEEEPTETGEVTEDRDPKPKDPEKNEDSQGPGPDHADGEDETDAEDADAEPETDAEAEDEEDAARPPRPPGPRNPRAADARDNARAAPTDTRAGPRGSR